MRRWSPLAREPQGDPSALMSQELQRFLHSPPRKHRSLGERWSACYGSLLHSPGSFSCVCSSVSSCTTYMLHVKTHKSFKKIMLIRIIIWWPCVLVMLWEFVWVHVCINTQETIKQNNLVYQKGDSVWTGPFVKETYGSHQLINSSFVYSVSPSAAPMEGFQWALPCVPSLTVSPGEGIQAWLQSRCLLGFLLSCWKIKIPVFLYWWLYQ